MTSPSAGAVSRRQLLRIGFFGSVALSAVSATAVLTGCSTPPAAQGYGLLRPNDLKVLRALLPVLLAGELPEGEARHDAIEETLRTLDSFLAGTSVAGQKQLAQLFDLMALPLTRYTIVGLSEDWDRAAPADIAAFLEHWRASRFDTLRAGYAGLTQTLNMMWYLQPRAWAAIGYVPPRVEA